MKKTFYAAKVNVHENIFNQNLENIIHKFIPEAILKMPTIKINSYNLSFTDAKEILFDGTRLIVGNITKSKYASQKVRIGSSTNIVRSEHELARTSFFVYHPQNEIIVYEVNSFIKDQDFRDFFTKFLSRDPEIGEVKIKPVPEPYKIRSELESIEIVTAVQFQLIHPNPGKTEFNLYNQIIQEARLKELDIKMVNSQGLQLEDMSETQMHDKISNNETIELKTYIELEEIQGSEKVSQYKTSIEDSLKKDSSNMVNRKYTRSIENGIALVESGYGSVEIKGFDIVTTPGKGKRLKKKKKNRTFSSSKSIRKITTNISNENGLLSRILNFIIDVKEKYSEKEAYDEEAFKQ